jgi:hypothetical protein
MLEVAAVGAPLVVFLSVRIALAPGPASAGAMPVAAAPGAAETGGEGAPKLSAAQDRALKWIRGLPAGPLASPMLHPRVNVPTEASKGEDDSPPDPLAGLKLNGVLGSGERGLATISGKIYRIGDEVRPGIKLRAVDARAGWAELERPDRTVVRLKREQ